MKVCEICGSERVGARDTEKMCAACIQIGASKAAVTYARVKIEREDALRSCGLVKVRGILGGTYWE